MKIDLPIVVAAYNRAESLDRLLLTLSNANYPKNYNITLYISIDFSGNDDCNKIAENFEWKFGEKKVIKQNENLGLKKHIVKCGDLSQNHDGIILLEDDLIVSPAFYVYSIAVFNFYRDNLKIAGCSLYSYEVNEFCGLLFSSIQDNFDAFFMKVPSSCGQLYSKSQWAFFKNSLNENIVLEDTDYLPPQVFNWPETSWKKYFFKHMLVNDLYFTYPHRSYTSNMGDIGTHFGREANFIRTNINIKTENFNFPDIVETINVYDQFMEIDANYYLYGKYFPTQQSRIEFDIYGYKPLHKIPNKTVITSRRVSEPISTKPITSQPIQLNVFSEFDSIKTSTKHRLYFAEIAQITDTSNRYILDYYATLIPPRIVNRYIQDVESNTAKAFYKSANYRLGKFLLTPIKLIRKLYTKIISKYS